MVIYISAFIITTCAIWLLIRKKLKPDKSSKFSDLKSDYSYSVFKNPINDNPSSFILILEGNRIDELGYQIYKSHIADLDKIDILIRDNKTGEIMKIVKDGDSESMIGVSHPENGHIGYLKYEIVNSGFKDI
jgi:hypothetical protein